MSSHGSSPPPTNFPYLQGYLVKTHLWAEEMCGLLSGRISSRDAGGGGAGRGQKSEGGSASRDSVVVRQPLYLEVLVTAKLKTGRAGSFLASLDDAGFFFIAADGRQERKTSLLPCRLSNCCHNSCIYMHVCFLYKRWPQESCSVCNC